MDLSHSIDNLAEYRRSEFFQYVGRCFANKRVQLGISIDRLAQQTLIEANRIREIESEFSEISQQEFNALLMHLDIEIFQIHEICRITHAQYMLEFYRIVDENYPK